MSASRGPKRRKHNKIFSGTKAGIPRCPTTGKGCYRNEKRAKTALNHLRSQGDPVNGVYKCWHCGDWHLTSHYRGAA